jgi:hypothetical protein
MVAKKYSTDREFTDFVHNYLAVPLIYKKLKWEVETIDNEYAELKDLNDGIDYHARDNLGLKVTIQERFRRSDYDYNDFTIRYTRNNSNDPNQVNSEFYKLSADYFIYGITSGDGDISEFKKVIVLDLNYFKRLLRMGRIRIPKKHRKQSEIVLENGKKVLYTALNRNFDYSSEFIAIDPEKLYEVIGDRIKYLIVYQKGFRISSDVKMNNELISPEFENEYYDNQ